MKVLSERQKRMTECSNLLLNFAAVSSAALLVTSTKRWKTEVFYA
jgi:hypothetical protein